jgi:hypothetical protein
VFIQINDLYIGTLFGESNGYRSSDAAIPACDDRYFVAQFPGSPVIRIIRFRARPHL